MEVSEVELQSLYTWVDEIPLSRPKRNIARDFSDGVLMAEVVHHYFPKIVELHNYSSANGAQQKMYNWNTLNQKVLKRLGLQISKEDMNAMCNCQPGAVERVLKLLKGRIAKCTEEGLPAPMPSAAPAQSKASPSHQQQQQHAGGQYMQGAPQQQQHMMMMPQPQMAMAAPRGMMPAPGGMAQAPMSLQARMGGGHSSEEVADLRETLTELKETNEILETKVRKLEQLVRLKDAKIQTLMAKLQAAGMA